MNKLGPALALLLVLAPACGDPGSGAASGAPSGAPAMSGAPAISGSPAGAASSAAADDNTPEEPGVKVLDKGAAPRTKLRYHPADAAVETLVLSQTRSEAMVGQKAQSMPTSKLTIALSSKATAPGEREGTYEVKDAGIDNTAGVPGAVATQIKQTLTKIVGSKGQFTVSDRGKVRKVDAAPLPGADPATAGFTKALADSMQAGFVPLPAAAVGVGAKWEYAYDVQQVGITVRMVATYEVTSIQGDDVKLKLTQSQTADKQSMDAGGGKKISITNYKVDATGDVVLKLARLSPLRSSAEAKGSMTMDGLAKGPRDIQITSSVLITGN